MNSYPRDTGPPPKHTVVPLPMRWMVHPVPALVVDITTRAPKHHPDLNRHILLRGYLVLMPNRVIPMVNGVVHDEVIMG